MAAAAFSGGSSVACLPIYFADTTPAPLPAAVPSNHGMVTVPSRVASALPSVSRTSRPGNRLRNLLRLHPRTLQRPPHQCLPCLLIALVQNQVREVVANIGTRRSTVRNRHLVAQLLHRALELLPIAGELLRHPA